MESYPLVSVAIPAYNHADYIEACLSSVYEQTYPELEVVLIDDGSTDGTYEIAERFLEKHGDRFCRVVLERRSNQGVSANSNACIDACQGEWVHLLGSDDVLYPKKIERIQESIRKWGCRDLALVHSDCDYIDQCGKIVTRLKLKSRPSPGPDFKAYQWIFLGKHYIFNPTVALRREAFLSIGGFDKTLNLEDLDCWLRLSTRFATARVPEVLGSYRKHPGNSSRKRLRMLSALFKSYAKFLEQNSELIDDTNVRRHFRRNVWRLWRRTRYKAPWLLPLVLLNVFRSHFRTPSAFDYIRLSAILDDFSAEVDV